MLTLSFQNLFRTMFQTYIFFLVIALILNNKFTLMFLVPQVCFGLVAHLAAPVCLIVKLPFIQTENVSGRFCNSALLVEELRGTITDRLL